MANHVDLGGEAETHGCRGKAYLTALINKGHSTRGRIQMDVILTDLRFTVAAGVVMTVILWFVAPLIAG